MVCMQEQFFLWLDESGDFANEVSKTSTNWNPSLVGGMLLKKPPGEADLLDGILGKDFIKMSEVNDDPGEFAINALEKAIQKGFEPVIFENKERIDIIDSTITYLNILSEGIIQLMQHLAIMHNEFILNICIAVRLDMEDGRDKHAIIRLEEYDTRLQEKIVLSMARRSLSNKQRYQYKISFASARKDKNLKLADIVCNTWLTRGSKKFTTSQQEMIRGLFGEVLYFTVFESSITSLIVRGDLANAIFEMCITGKQGMSNANIEKALERWQTLNDNEQKIHFHILNEKIRALILVDRNLRKSKEALNYLQDTILCKMKNINACPDLFELQVCLKLCAIYTHEGDIRNADKQFKIFDAVFKNISKRWELFDYYFEAKIRHAVHTTNCFDFQCTVEEMGNVIKALGDAATWLSMVDDDELKGIFREIKIDILGKALGTRLQAYCFLIRKEEDAYKRAVKDSENAIEQFSSDTDKKRQYQYRSQVECEAGNFDDSLRWLLKAADIEYDKKEGSVTAFLCRIDKKPVMFQFYMMHYMRLMAESFVKEKIDIANMMYNCLCKESEIMHKLKNLDSKDHPVNIIFWKLATYNIMKNNYNAAKNFYNKALHICFCRPERLTLRAIGLGVLAEKAARFLKVDQQQNKEIWGEGCKAIKELSQRHKEFIKLELPIAMKSYFASWEDIIADIEAESNMEVKSKALWELSREIPY